MGADGVVVADGTLVDVLDAVSHPTGIGQLLDQLLYLLSTLGNLLDELHVTGRQALGLLRVEQRRREDFLDALHVLDEFRLVVRGDGDDVVHGEVAQHTSLNLNGLDVHLPFHLVASLQLLAVHDLGTLEHLDA